MPTKTSRPKWHKDKDGRILPCTANIRNCRYATHYETKTDAADTRSRTVEMDNKNYEDTLVFDQAISLTDYNIDYEKADENQDMRSVGDKAQEIFRRTGKHARFPEGQIEIDFGYGNLLNIKRENFNMVKNGRTASRYYMTFWHNDHYIHDSVVLMPVDNGWNNYANLQEVVQKFFNKARDHHSKALFSEAYTDSDREEAKKRLTEYDRKLKVAYKDTISTIDNLQILSQGAMQAYKDYGIDVFSKDTPGVLELDVDCSRSSLQSYDIVDALKIHASTDNDIHKISLRFRDATAKINDKWLNPHDKNTQVTKWSLTRIPEGQWYFSYQMDGETFSNAIDIKAQSTTVRKTVMEILTEVHLSEKRREEKAEFMVNILKEIEPAIEAYERTVNNRIIRRSRSQSETPKVEPAPEPMKKKIFGLFS